MLGTIQHTAIGNYKKNILEEAVTHTNFFEIKQMAEDPNLPADVQLLLAPLVDFLRTEQPSLYRRCRAFQAKEFFARLFNTFVCRGSVHILNENTEKVGTFCYDNNYQEDDLAWCDTLSALLVADSHELNGPGSNTSLSAMFPAGEVKENLLKMMFDKDPARGGSSWWSRMDKLTIICFGPIVQSEAAKLPTFTDPDNDGLDKKGMPTKLEPQGSTKLEPPGSPNKIKFTHVAQPAIGHGEDANSLTKSQQHPHQCI